MTRPVTTGTGAPRGSPTACGRSRGSLTLEVAAVLPLVAIVLSGLLQSAVVLRDLLVVQEAARAGVRAAVTMPHRGAVTAAVRDVAGSRDPEVHLSPPAPGPGDLVTVRVAVVSRIGPLRPRLVADAVGLVEPGAARLPRPPGPPGRTAP